MIKKGWEVISRYPDYMISADGEVYSIKRRKILKKEFDEDETSQANI